MSIHPHRTCQTAKELFLERAAAYFDEMKNTAQNAPYGQVFDYVEAFAVKQGQELLRQSTEALLQEQVDEFEKKEKRHSVRNAKRKNDIAATDVKKE
jgi:hypothetical protein